jgi:hypothetical protein
LIAIPLNVAVVVGTPAAEIDVFSAGSFCNHSSNPVLTAIPQDPTIQINTSTGLMPQGGSTSRIGVGIIHVMDVTKFMLACQMVQASVSFAK